jgi:hypothetical protein
MEGGVSQDLSDLARRWSRAVERGRGLRIEANDLDVLTSIGVNDLIQAIAAEKLKERARWRGEQRRAGSISAETSGSTGTERATEASGAPTSQSSGMTPGEDATDLLAHALQISRRRGRR